MRAHFVERGFADAGDGIFVAQRLGAVGAGAHVVERRLLGAGAGRDGGLRVGGLDGLVLALDAGS
jgi:hypothetical protein